jgi:hypothetical protein
MIIASIAGLTGEKETAARAYPRYLAGWRRWTINRRWWWWCSATRWRTTSRWCANTPPGRWARHRKVTKSRSAARLRVIRSELSANTPEKSDRVKAGGGARVELSALCAENSERTGPGTDRIRVVVTMLRRGPPRFRLWQARVEGRGSGTRALCCGGLRSRILSTKRAGAPSGASPSAGPASRVTSAWGSAPGGRGTKAARHLTGAS